MFVYFSKFSNWLHCYLVLSFETEAAEKAKKGPCTIREIFGLEK
jgi:hypothetical protein